MEAVTDSLKTTAIGTGTMWMQVMNWLPDAISIFIGLMTMIYLYYKIRNEYRK
jgi:hypothetical protein